MVDEFTEVTRQGWFSRIGNSFKGIIVGILLIGIAFSVLWWNEGRSVTRARTLKEGAGAVVPVSAESIDPAREGALVHLSGETVIGDTLEDQQFGVSVRALHLERKVEMYQWDEEVSSKSEKKLGGSEETTTTYKYSKVWSDDVIRSSNFKQPGGHTNPDRMPFKSESRSAKQVHVGAFRLSQSLINMISKRESLPVDAANARLPEEERLKARFTAGTIYLGSEGAVPQLGDVRISFSQVKPATVSIVARQEQGTLGAYLSKGGGKLELLSYGVASADVMFEQAKQANVMLTWILRGVGLLLMFLGFASIFRIFSVVADLVPFIGTIVGMGTGLVAFLIAASLSLVTIALAWIFYRPLIGIPLLAAAVGLVVWLVVLWRKRKAAVIRDR